MIDNVENVFKYARTRGLPYYCYTKNEKIKEFGKILKSKFQQGIQRNIILQNLQGIGLAWSYFPHHWEVPVLHMKRPIDVWNDDNLLKKAIASRIKWGGVVQKDGSMTDACLRKAIRTASGVQAVSNFRPTAAASIYYNYAKDGVVWDMCGGYGGRLLGAYASGKVKKYICTEPCTKTYNGLVKMKNELPDLNNNLFNSKMEVELYKCGAEDFLPKEKVDLCFSSPPYFNTERYSEEKTQSFKKYPTKEKWVNLFLKKMLKNCIKSLKANGKILINISNVKSFNNLEEETIRMSNELDLKLEKTLKLRLSSLYAGGFKHEPIFVFILK
jgi:hypothetical protein